MPNDAVTETIEIQLLSLTGEGITLKVEKSMLGREVRQMVSTELPGRAGAKMVLHHMREKLKLAETLEQQGIDKTATLSCTYVPTNLYLAWCFVKGFPTQEAQFALEGVTSLGVQTFGEFLFHLPKSLRSLILQQPKFGNWDLSRITLPSSLQNLTFGFEFNQSLEGVTLPSSLQNLTLSRRFNRSLERVTLPSSLRTLTCGDLFNQSLEGVALPSSLQNLTFGSTFNQSLEGVTLPSSLQNLTFGIDFNQSLEGVTLPSSLQNLTLGEGFNQSLQGVILPGGLQNLTFGWKFN